MKTVTKNEIAKIYNKILLRHYRYDNYEQTLYTAEILLEYYQKNGEYESAKKYCEICLLIMMLDTKGSLSSIDDIRDYAGADVSTQMGELFQLYETRRSQINKLIFRRFSYQKDLDFGLDDHIGGYYYQQFLNNFKNLYPNIELDLETLITFDDLDVRAKAGGDDQLFADCWSYSFSYIESKYDGINLTANMNCIEELLKLDPNNSYAIAMLESVFDILSVEYPIHPKFSVVKLWLDFFLLFPLEYKHWSLAEKAIKTIIKIGKVEKLKHLFVKVLPLANEKEFHRLLELLIPYPDIYNDWCEDIVHTYARDEFDLEQALWWNLKIIGSLSQTDTLMYYIFDYEDESIAKHSGAIMQILNGMNNHYWDDTKDLDQVIKSLWRAVN